MGEAKQRKLAAAAGIPWQCDRPRPGRILPWYDDPMCPALPPRDLEVMRTAVKARGLGKRVLVVGDEPIPPHVQAIAEADERNGGTGAALAPSLGRRRRSPLEMAMIMAALSMDSQAASLIAPPGGRGPKR